MRRAMHYHIRWSGTKLDWERFSTRQEAERAARKLARPGERFTLEHVDDKTCMLKICKLLLANNNRRR